MAEQEGVPVSRYVKWESGIETPDSAPVGRLKDNERCVIMRRRVGTTQDEIASALNRCRRWVQMMELGRVPCDDLLWYWEQ
jgi:DNA-binding transcriptional regulator YiaG